MYIYKIFKTMVDKKLIIKYFRDKRYSVDLETNIKEFVVIFNNSTEYEKYLIAHIIIEGNCYLMNTVFDRLSYICELNKYVSFLWNKSNIFIGDYKDIGCYVKHRSEIFKVCDRNYDGELFSIDGTCYHSGKCEPSSLKELREKKLRSLFK
jgi:hypothetical protein